MIPALILIGCIAGGCQAVFVFGDNNDLETRKAMIDLDADVDSTDKSDNRRK